VKDISIQEIELNDAQLATVVGGCDEGYRDEEEGDREFRSDRRGDTLGQRGLLNLGLQDIL
jgi:hypothetical protein